MNNNNQDIFWPKWLISKYRIYVICISIMSAMILILDIIRHIGDCFLRNSCKINWLYLDLTVGFLPGYILGTAIFNKILESEGVTHNNYIRNIIPVVCGATGGIAFVLFLMTAFLSASFLAPLVCIFWIVVLWKIISEIINFIRRRKEKSRNRGRTTKPM